jgi:hypothetical protein
MVRTFICFPFPLVCENSIRKHISRQAPGSPITMSSVINKTMINPGVSAPAPLIPLPPGDRETD